MIPKIIHYCWFGENPLPEKYKGYIDEWKLLHQDWEIKVWDERTISFDTPYLITAAKNKNWANISNLVRLQALDREGGIYLDTDIKLIKPLNDLCNNECFLGFEAGGDNTNSLFVNNAVLGSIKGHPFIKKSIKFLSENFDGTEKANESSPVMTTQILKNFYNLHKYGEQLLADGIKIFPKEYFYPIPWYLAKQNESYQEYITADTYAVHMWGRTWFTKEMMLEMIDELQSWGQDQKLLISGLNTDIETYKCRAEEAVKQQQQDLQIHTNLAAEYLATIEAQKMQLQQQEAAYLATIEMQKMQLQQQEIEIFQFARKLDFSEEKQKALEMQLSERNNSIRQLNTSIHLINKSYLRMEGKIAALHEEIKNLQSDRDKFEEQAASYYKEVLSYQASIEWYKRTYDNRKIVGIVKDKVLKIFNK